MLTFRRFMLASAFSMLATSAVACGGMGEGDYTVYRVAYHQAKLDDACQNQIDPNQETTSSLANAGTFILYFGADDTPMLDTGDIVLEGKMDGDDAFTFVGETKNTYTPVAEQIYDSDHDGLDDYEADPFVDADGDTMDDMLDDPMVDTDGDALDDRFEDELVDLNNDGKDDRFTEVLMDAKFTQSVKITIALDVAGDVISGEARSTNAESCEGTACPPNMAQSCTQTRAFDGIEIEDAQVDVQPGSSVD